MMSRRSVGALCIVALLASCGTGRPNAETSPLAAGIKQIRQLLQIRKAGGREAAAADANSKLQKFVQDADGAVIIGIVEDLKIPVVLQPEAQNGPHITWRTPDDRTMTLVGGVVSATRGFGGDILAYDAVAAGPAIASRGASEYKRSMRFLGPQYELKAATLTCKTENKGTEDVKIVDTQMSLVHMSEACTDQGGGTVVSDYWVDSSGRVWQSRQWLGPQLGYVFFQLVKAP
jgi:Group 4 capsule polysaccharide lipoprotein gfcB, YjbF